MQYPHDADEPTIPDRERPEQVPPPTTRNRRSGCLRPGTASLLLFLILVAFLVGGIAGWAVARTNAVAPALTGTTLEQLRVAVAAKVRPTAVEVIAPVANGKAIGSGELIDARGYIVTNNHVIRGARTVQVVLYDGTNIPATIAGTDPSDDLAVLKIRPPQEKLTVITLGDSSKLHVGQEVLAIGNPLGINETVTHGIVSALGRTVSEGQGGPVIHNAIQTDAPINPGNSGGALVDLQGNLVGIPTLTALDPEFHTPATGVGFAIPSNRVGVVVPEIIKTGKVPPTG
jgi:S1-C subfamily serine protease